MEGPIDGSLVGGGGIGEGCDGVAKGDGRADGPKALRAEEAGEDDVEEDSETPGAISVLMREGDCIVLAIAADEAPKEAVAPAVAICFSCSS